MAAFALVEHLAGLCRISEAEEAQKLRPRLDIEHFQEHVSQEGWRTSLGRITHTFRKIPSPERLLDGSYVGLVAARIKPV